MREKLRVYFDLVKFEHTIFALPFGLSSIVLLVEKIPSLKEIMLVTVALVSARTLGMALNRLIDEPYDKINPRTRRWPLVSGLVSRREVYYIIILSSFIFLLSSYTLNILAFYLSPLIILLLIIYPFAKRFVYVPHLVLGLVYFLIPVAVDVALNAKISLISIIMGVGMAFWVAGFDILYALQDYEFDLKAGLKSIPVKFGIERSISISGVFHTVTFVSFLILGFVHEKLEVIYFMGLAIISFIFIYQRRIVKPGDLSKLNVAFFTSNGYISIIFFLIVLADRIY